MMTEELTQEKLDSLMRDALRTAKTIRALKGFEGDETEFLPVAILVVPEEYLIVGMPFEDETKHLAMDALALVAREKKALAVLLVHDSRMVKLPETLAYFGVSATLTKREQNDICHRLVHECYGGRILNLPRELWTDALVVSIKGPVVEQKVLALRYAGGENGSVVWLGEEEQKIDSSPLPDWWRKETTIQ